MDYETFISHHSELNELSDDIKREAYAMYLDTLEDLYSEPV